MKARIYAHEYPGGAWWDSETQSYWNLSEGGQELRDINDYGADSDGCYTPFGDE